jgi:hypothetical protein
MTPVVICRFSAIASSESRESTKSVVFSGSTRSVVTSSCTTGAELDVGGRSTAIDVLVEIEVEVVDEVVVVVEVLVVIVGITKMVVVVVDSVSRVAAIVVVASSLPTVSEKTDELAKLYESPVHVPPNGLSRPYAYI